MSTRGVQRAQSSTHGAVSSVVPTELSLFTKLSTFDTSCSAKCRPAAWNLTMLTSAYDYWHIAEHPHTIARLSRSTCCLRGQIFLPNLTDIC